eukprot:gene5922-8167_t
MSKKGIAERTDNDVSGRVSNNKYHQNAPIQNEYAVDQSDELSQITISSNNSFINSTLPSPSPSSINVNKNINYQLSKNNTPKTGNILLLSPSPIKLRNKTSVSVSSTGNSTNTFIRSIANRSNVPSIVPSRVSSIRNITASIRAATKDENNSDTNTKNDVEENDELKESFEKKKNEYVLQKLSIKQLKEQNERLEMKKRNLIWRADGEKAMNKLGKALGGFHAILEPHNLKKQTINILQELFQTVMTTLKNSVYHKPSLSSKLLNMLTQTKKKMRNKSKSKLIELKFMIMKEIRDIFIRKYIYQNYIPNISRIKVMRILYDEYTMNIPVNIKIRKSLGKKRYKLKAAEKKLALIYKTMESCEFIGICKSNQHYNTKGCSNCGVLYFGTSIAPGSTERMQYVTSYSRDTGVATLVTLEFEKETLKKEEEAQLLLLDNLRNDLSKYEEDNLNPIRENLQVWSAIILASKHMRKNERKIMRSLRKFKLNRLMKLKHEIDLLIKEPQPLDMNYLSEKYCDIIPALLEHSSSEIKKKQERLAKHTKLFYDKMMKIYYDYLERLRLERLRKANEIPPDPPIVRKIIKCEKEQNYICFRTECQLRDFLTRDRYETHMGIHRKEDKIKQKLKDENKKLKLKRANRSQEFLKVLSSSRQYLLSNNSDNSIANESSNYGLSTEDSLYLDFDHDFDDESNDGNNNDKRVFNNFEYEGYNGENSSQSYYNHQNIRKDIQINESSYSLPSIQSSPTTKSSEIINNLTLKSFPNNEINKSFSLSKSLKAVGAMTLQSTSSLPSITSPSVDRNHDMQSVSPVPYNAHGTDYGSDNYSSNHNSITTDNVSNSSLSRTEWSNIAHLFTLNNMFNSSLYFLEMVSKHDNIDVAPRIPLDQPIIRIGSNKNLCEYVIKTNNRSYNSNNDCISNIHCIFYCPMNDDKNKRNDSNSSNHANNSITIVDNNSLWGTYAVTSKGTFKVPKKMTSGYVVSPGMLICIGVMMDGPQELSPTDANKACVVYRVRCLDRE